MFAALVTILHRRRHGYDVRIHIDDHEPAHVRVHRERKRVRVYLDPIEFEDNRGFNGGELRQIRTLIGQHVNLLRNNWDRLHRSGGSGEILP